MKTVDLHVRPVFVYSEQRVSADVFLCMLAYYVEWHMRERLKPILFDDEHLDEASAARASPVAEALRSEHAKAKDASKTADDGSTLLHSFRTLLQDLSTLAYNITFTLNPEAKILTTTRPTPLQAEAFKLLGLNPACTSSTSPANEMLKQDGHLCLGGHQSSPKTTAVRHERPVSEYQFDDITTDIRGHTR